MSTLMKTKPFAPSSSSSTTTMGRNNPPPLPPSLLKKGAEKKPQPVQFKKPAAPPAPKIQATANPPAAAAAEAAAVVPEKIIDEPSLSESHLYTITQLNSVSDWKDIEKIFSNHDEHPFVNESYMDYGITDRIQPEIDNIAPLHVWFVDSMIRYKCFPEGSTPTYWSKEEFLRRVNTFSNGQIHKALLPLHDSCYTPRFKAIILPIYSKHTLHYSVLVYYVEEPHTEITIEQRADETENNTGSPRLTSKRLVRLYHYDSLHSDEHKFMAEQCAVFLKGYDFFYHDKSSYDVEVIHATDFPIQKGVSCGTWCLSLLLLLHIQFRLQYYGPLKPEFYQRLKNDYVVKCFQRNADAFRVISATYHDYFLYRPEIKISGETFAHAPSVQVPKLSIPSVAAKKPGVNTPLSGIKKLSLATTASKNSTAIPNGSPTSSTAPKDTVASQIKSILYDQEATVDQDDQEHSAVVAQLVRKPPSKAQHAHQSALLEAKKQAWKTLVWEKLPLRRKLLELETSQGPATEHIISLSNSSKQNDNAEALKRYTETYINNYRIIKAVSASFLDSEELRLICDKDLHENISQKAVKLYASKAIFSDNVHVHACFDLDVLSREFMSDIMCNLVEYDRMLSAKEQNIPYERQLAFVPYCYTIWVHLGKEPPLVLSEATIFVQKHSFSHEGRVYSEPCVIYGAEPAKDVLQQYYNNIMFAEHGYTQYERWIRSEEANLARVTDLDSFMDFFNDFVLNRGALSEPQDSANLHNQHSLEKEELMKLSMDEIAQRSALRYKQISVVDYVLRSSRERLPFERVFVHATTPAWLLKDTPYLPILLLRQLCSDPNNVPKTQDEVVRYLFGESLNTLETERSMLRMVKTLMKKTECSMRGVILEHFSKSFITLPPGFDAIMPKDLMIPSYYHQYAEEGGFDAFSNALAEWWSAYKGCSFSEAIKRTLEIVENSRTFAVQMAMIQAQISYLTDILAQSETVLLGKDYWRGEPVVSYVYKKNPEAFQQHPLMNIASNLSGATKTSTDSPSETVEERNKYLQAISTTLDEFGFDGTEYMAEVPDEKLRGLIEDKLAKWQQLYELMASLNATRMTEWMKTTPFFAPLYDRENPTTPLYNYPWSSAVKAFTATQPDTEPLHGAFFSYINSLLLEPDANDTALNVAVGGTAHKRTPTFDRNTFDGVRWPLTLEAHTLPFEIQKVFYLFPLILEHRSEETGAMMESFTLTPLMAYLLILHTPKEVLDSVMFQMSAQEFVNKCSAIGLAPRTFHTPDSPFIHAVVHSTHDKNSQQKGMEKTFRDWFQRISKSIGHGLYSLGCMLETINSDAYRDMPLEELLLKCAYLLVTRSESMSEYMELRDQSKVSWHTDKRIFIDLTLEETVCSTANTAENQDNTPEETKKRRESQEGDEPNRNTKKSKKSVEKT